MRVGLWALVVVCRVRSEDTAERRDGIWMGAPFTTPPWERDSCLGMYGSEKGLPRAKMAFDMAPAAARTTFEAVLKGRTSRSWPPEAGERVPFGALAERIGRTAAGSANHSLRGGGIPLGRVGATLSVDPFARLIYVANWKCGSTSFQNLMSSPKQPKMPVPLQGHKFTHHVRDWINLAATDPDASAQHPGLKAFLQGVGTNCSSGGSSSSRGEKCFLSRSRESVFKALDLSDEVLDTFFVFTFVRDPFSRIVSQYHQANPHIPFDAMGTGEGRASNIHLTSQAGTLVSSGVSSGRRLRLDFVGRLEYADEDLRRLLPAFLAPELSPRDRRALVRKHLVEAASNFSNVGVGKARVHHDPPPPSKTAQDRESGGTVGALADTQPLGGGEAEPQPPPWPQQPQERSSQGKRQQPPPEPRPMNEYLEVMTCRRYLQDFACFGYSVPHTCVKYVDLLL